MLVIAENRVSVDFDPVIHLGYLWSNKELYNLVVVQHGSLFVCVWLPYKNCTDSAAALSASVLQ